ncbi:MAG: ABC transporter substrate-binding protein, partial [Candidatus Wildermuthbacteria bacterium]|nr:ABC transporter substrate-binding protein [Candidatus Wildermuthbacteria bacterium]
MAKDYQILEEGKIYEFELKENILWQDGKPLTAEDVVFTIRTIQNPDYKSPLRANWLGVLVEKISDLAVRFKLKTPSAVFLENLTVKILPKHIWENISASNFPLTAYNLKPVGSGPFKFKSLEQDSEGKITSLELVRNNNYFGKSANITRIYFKFFESEEKGLMKSWSKKEIDGFAPSSARGDIDIIAQANLYSPALPRYFAVFLNPLKAKIFAQSEIRQALNYGTNKQEIINNLLQERGKITDSPILPEIYGYKPPSKTYEFNLEKAKSLLDKAGFAEGENGIREKIVKKEPPFQFKSNLKTGSAGTEVKELQKCLARDPKIYPEGEISGYFGQKTKNAVIKFQEKYSQNILQPAGLDKGSGDVLKLTRDKLNEVCLEKTEDKILLKFTLTTSDYPQLQALANILKEQWKILGIDVEIKTFDIGQLERDFIKTRDYDALLFGEILGSIEDPFPFWHSSQKKDPGLNLAIYENKEADRLLEEARQAMDENERKEKLEKFQNILINDSPAVLLYNPDYLYLVVKKIKGIDLKTILDPSKRFSNIESWYINTKRAWK